MEDKTNELLNEQLTLESLIQKIDNTPNSAFQKYESREINFNQIDSDVKSRRYRRKNK